MDPFTLDRIQRAVGDRYEIEALAGRGGMGAVYRGRHRTLGSAVAVKVLPVPAEPGSDELARFEREARLAATLPHPHIVPVFELEVVDDLAFFVMPFVEGQSLARHLEEHGRMAVADLLELLRQIGGALAFAHDRGVVHRDVKPANILRETATGRWLMADFGVARATAGDRTITRSGMVVGTPAYMAPEQAAGAPDVDGRADLYALAAVACEALTGARTDTLRDAAENEVLLRAARPDLPRPVAQAIASALAFDRTRRPADVRAWLADVEAVVGGGRGAGVLPRPARWLVWLGGAAAAAALAGVAVFSGYRTARDAPPTRTVAVVPALLDGRAGDASLHADLTLAFEDQLRWLEDYRIVGAAAVEHAVTERFGAAGRTWEMLVPLLRERFGVTELLVIDGSVDAAHDVRIALQLRAVPDGVIEHADTASGPLDSLPSLVSRLVTDGFARRLARERTGWSEAVPAGLQAVQAWFAADRAFRRAEYDRAVELYEAVVASDSTFAPAHFRRMLSEILRLRPTQATDAVYLALGATRRFRDGLDPTTADLFAAYELLITEGDVEGAHETLQRVVERRPGAVDAWFLLGYVRFLLGPLIGVPIAQARFPFERAHELHPRFAAPIAQLALLAVLEEDAEAARRYFTQYLAVDSVSTWARLVRLADSLLHRGDRVALATVESLADRPVAVLELIAFGGRTLTMKSANRIVARRAAEILLVRAATAGDRAAAFRIVMSALLAEGRLDAAAAAWRAGRRQGVPRDELDRWAVLAAVTGVCVLGAPEELHDAAVRLAARSDDTTALWLAAVYLDRVDPPRARPPAAALRGFAGHAAAGPLARSLVMDLEARARLAAGDTAGALGRWHEATRRYSIGRVPFGLVGSLWPLKLAWGRIAAARDDPVEVLRVTASLEDPAGLHDRTAWWIVLPMRVDALAATEDPLTARHVREAALRLLEAAEGPAATTYERLAAGEGS